MKMMLLEFTEGWAKKGLRGVGGVHPLFETPPLLGSGDGDPTQPPSPPSPPPPTVVVFMSFFCHLEGLFELFRSLQLAWQLLSIYALREVG